MPHPVFSLAGSSRAGCAGRAVAAAALTLAFAAPLATLATLAPGPAAAQTIRTHGDPTAEAFVQTQADRAISILDASSGKAAEKQTFYAFVNEVADVPRITDFVLGRYRRTLSPEQYARFSTVFRTYVDSVYESRLSQYHGEKLQVTGSVVRTPGDAVVSSLVVGGSFKGVPVVNWRVIRGAGGWKVVDVQAKGVWLAVVEQQDFTSTLSNHNGDIEVLIRQLQNGAMVGTGKPAG